MPKVDDMILTVLTISPDRKTRCRERDRNDRGRGMANRTHDVYAQNATMYRINLIEYDEYFNVSCTMDDKRRNRSYPKTTEI